MTTLLDLEDTVVHAPQANRTTVPVRTGAGTHARPPRRRAFTAAGMADVLGALLSSTCLTILLFGLLVPLEGAVGEIIVEFVLFVGIYALLVGLHDDRQAVIDKTMTVLLAGAALLMVGALASVLLYVVLGQRHAALRAMDHLSFYTQDLRKAGPKQSLAVGGIRHALVGTAWTITIAMGITVPLGLTTAVFLNEVGGQLARFVRTIVEAMIGLPSIVAGLFIFAAVVLPTHQHTGLAAGLALAVDMLPIIIRAADVVLRLVPGNLREASLALGAPEWRTVRTVVLPTARSGLATAVILGMARGLGETAPVLLTAGYTTYVNTNPLHGSMVSLPLAAYELIKSGEPNQIARGYGAATVLLLLVIAVFTVARVVGGRGPGQLSARQARRAQRHSIRDANRIIRSYGLPVAEAEGSQP